MRHDVAIWNGPSSQFLPGFNVVNQNGAVGGVCGWCLRKRHRILAHSDYVDKWMPGSLENESNVLQIIPENGFWKKQYFRFFHLKLQSFQFFQRNIFLMLFRKSLTRTKPAKLRSSSAGTDQLEVAGKWAIFWRLHELKTVTAPSRSEIRK